MNDSDAATSVDTTANTDFIRIAAAELSMSMLSELSTGTTPHFCRFLFAADSFHF